MPIFEGFVDGIDVQVARTGRRKSVTCYAFINEQLGSTNNIQVETEEHDLQTALELASSKEVAVEVDYDVIDGSNTLNRVRLLDR